jgi:hypothetical protein
MSAMLDSLTPGAFGSLGSEAARQVLGGATTIPDSRLTVVAWTYVDGEWYPAKVEEDAPPVLIA